MKRVLGVTVWIVLGTLFGTDTPSPALACSGSMQPIDYLVEQSDVVVKVEVVEVDDLSVEWLPSMFIQDGY